MRLEFQACGMTRRTSDAEPNFGVELVDLQMDETPRVPSILFSLCNVEV